MPDRIQPGVVEAHGALRRAKVLGWFTRKPSLRLDLAKDRNAFIALIAAAVAAFNKAPPKGLKPITRVDIRFDLTSEAYPRVWLELDDAPGGESYTSDVNRYRIMERVCKHWAPPCHAIMDGKPITVVASDRSTVVRDETSLYGAAGLFFVEMMISLRKAGVFKPLPRDPSAIWASARMTGNSAGPTMTSVAMTTWYEQWTHATFPTDQSWGGGKQLIRLDRLRLRKGANGLEDTRAPQSTG